MAVSLPIFVRASDIHKLRSLLTASGAEVHEINDQGLTVGGLTSDQVGGLAFKEGITILELTPQRASLEEVFMDLTADSVEYGGGTIGVAHD